MHENDLLLRFHIIHIPVIQICKIIVLTFDLFHIE